MTGALGHASCTNGLSQCSGASEPGVGSPRASVNGLVPGVFLSMDHGLGGVTVLLLGVSSRIHQGKRDPTSASINNEEIY